MSDLYSAGFSFIPYIFHLININCLLTNAYKTRNRSEIRVSVIQMMTAPFFSPVEWIVFLFQNIFADRNAEHWGIVTHSDCL